MLTDDSVASSRNDLVHSQQTARRLGGGFKRMVKGVGGQPRRFDGRNLSVDVNAGRVLTRSVGRPQGQQRVKAVNTCVLG